MKNGNEESPYLGCEVNENFPYTAERLESHTLRAICADEQGFGSPVGSRDDTRMSHIEREDSGKELIDIKEADKGESELSTDDEKLFEKPWSKRAKIDQAVVIARKAHREKARREKLNERFEALSKLIDPSNDPKSDKSAILGDAIRFAQQIRIENHQLRQLNKFLEERVADYERERGRQLYNQSMLMGGLPPPGGASSSSLPGAVPIPRNGLSSSSSSSRPHVSDSPLAQSPNLAASAHAGMSLCASVLQHHQHQHHHHQQMQLQQQMQQCQLQNGMAAAAAASSHIHGGHSNNAAVAASNFVGVPSLAAGGFYRGAHSLEAECLHNTRTRNSLHPHPSSLSHEAHSHSGVSGMNAYGGVHSMGPPFVGRQIPIQTVTYIPASAISHGAIAGLNASSSEASPFHIHAHRVGSGLLSSSALYYHGEGIDDALLRPPAA